MSNNTQSKCKSCGAAVSETDKNCPVCGTPIVRVNTERETVSGEQKKFFRKKLFIPAAVFTLIVVLLNIIPNLRGNVKYISAQYGIFVSEFNPYVYFYSNNKKKGTAEGKLSESVVNLYGNKAFFIVNDNKGNAVLYNVNGKAIDMGIENCKISVEGKICAYTRVQDSVKQLFICTGKKAYYISETNGEYVLSPNGKTVLFTGSDGKTYIYNKKITEVGTGLTPVAVSDNGKYIYYTSDNGTFVQKDIPATKTQKLSENISNDTEIQLYFNCDFTEIAVFANDGNNSFVCKKAGIKTYLDFAGFKLLTPDSVPFANNTYGVTTFKNSFVLTDNGEIYYIDNYLKCVKTNFDNSEAKSVFLASDNKTVCYFSNGEVYKIDGTKEKAEKELIVKTGVVAVLGFNRDGSGVYFENENGGISFSGGKDKSKVISDNYDLTYPKELFGDYKFYYILNGNLYLSASGKKGKLLKKAPSDLLNVYTLNSVILITDSQNQTYFSVDGKKFTQCNYSA